MIHNPQENGVMMATISEVRPETPFWDKLQKDECKSLQQFYRRADKIMRLETAREAVQAGKPTPSEKNNDNDKTQKNGDCHSSLEKTNKKAKDPDSRVSRPPPRKFTNYTDLVSSQEDVFMAIEHIGLFNWPDSLRGDRSKKNQNKHCRFHKDIGHTNKECITLKDEIEKLIHHGYLQDYVNDRRARPQYDRPEAEPLRKIRMIFDGPYFAWETRGAQDCYIWETRDRSLTNANSLDKRPTKQFKGEKRQHHLQR